MNAWQPNVSVSGVNDGFLSGTSAPATPLVQRHRGAEPRAASFEGIVQGQKERHRFLWQDFFLDPALWWDNRPQRRSSRHPDICHRRSREALWLDDRYKPAWIDSQLCVQTAQLRDGMREWQLAGSTLNSFNASVLWEVPKLEENLMCSKLCEEGDLTAIVEALEFQLEQGYHIDHSVLYKILKRCIAQKDLVLGKRIHALTVKCGYGSNTFLANHIIRMYAFHGKLEEARQVFTKVGLPDTFMWASIIKAHSEHGQPKQAIELYRQMRESILEPNNYVFVAALKACATATDLTAGKEVHSDFLESAVDPGDIFVGNCLVNMYAKCGSLEDARKVFDNVRTRDVVTWTAMIAGYVQHGLDEEALGIYASMQLEGITPANNVTFLCLLQACAAVGALHEGKQLHSEIVTRGWETDVFVSSCLVDMYAKCGSLDDARRVFDNLPNRDVVTWTVMIGGYAQHGLGQEALSLYGCMQQEGMLLADGVAFSWLLKACASNLSLHQGKQLHAQIQERGLQGDVVVSSCLVDMYAKCGSLEDARKVFDQMAARNVVTWTAMIAGYALHGFNQEALTLYASMQQEGMVLADRVTFVCLLKACAIAGASHQGMKLHSQIQERGLADDALIGSCLVDMYAKCGKLEDARKVFDKLPTRDVVTWTVLLNGYTENSESRMAFRCFEEMQEQGVKPDETTYTCLLVACSHEGLVNEAQRYFKMMVEENEVTPSAYHYGCMVDILGRSGLLAEAERMLQGMPFENDVAGWTSLLSACKSHNDIERGRRCFDHLVTLEPENGTAYVLLGAMYANAGRWKDAYRIESLRKSAGAKKKAAKACIEVKHHVHEFIVGEEMADVSYKLRSVNLRLKEEGGHVPQTELVLKAVPETDKEDALCGHAEKLALAYGLLNTASGTTLLVTKNLRMCNDCHHSTKIMSRLENREIVVRDAHRVHRFVKGSCSCRDRH